MKYLYYNPYEYPNEIKLISKKLGINERYTIENANNKPCSIEKLFKLAESNNYEEINVYLTSHNCAYFKTAKKSTERFNINGWINLKEYKNGGGYLNDTI